MVESIHNVPTLISQYIATVDTDDQIANAYTEQLAELIVEDELSLLEFIQSLGPTLTSDTDALRSKSMHCLTSTLEHLNGSPKLSRQDINVIIDFLLSKLDDKASLQWVLSSLQSLVGFKNFNPGLNQNLKRLLNAILSDYDPKKNLAKIRYESFAILKNVLLTQKDYLLIHQDISDTYVKAFIHIASGEKDPRNLLVSFHLNSSINKTLVFDPNNDLHGEFVTDLFDVSFCYFPISFTPPANDPYKITADQLKSELRSTIASQSLFAKDSFSSLIEKLTSTNPTIRNDVLKTLQLCVESYSNETVEEYWLTLWNALKFEILHNDVSIFKPQLNEIIPEDYESSIEDSDDNKALILTLVIISTLFEKLDGTTKQIQATIINDLKDNLVSVKEKSQQSILILSAIASQSTYAFDQVIEFVFSYNNWGKYINVENNSIEVTPQPQEEDKNDELILNVSKQRDLVDNLGFIFTAYKVLYSKLGSGEADEFAARNQLTQFKDHLLIFMGQLLTASSNLEKTLKCKVVQQLTKLSSLPKYLSQNENELILGYFKDIIVDTIEKKSDNWEKDIVLKEVTTGVINIIDNDHKVDLAIELIITPLLNLLDEKEELIIYTKIINIIGDLCINYRILEVLSIRLLNKLIAINHSVVPIDKKINLFVIIIESFTSWIVKIETNKQFLTNSWYQNFVPKFLDNVFHLLAVKEDYVLIELSGDLVGLIIKFIDKSHHQDILNDFVKIFFTSESSTPLISYKENVLETPTAAVALLNKVLSSIDKSTQFKEVSVNETVDNAIEVIYSIPDDEFLRIQYLQTTSLLVNKFGTDDSIVSEKLSELLTTFKSLSADDKLTKKLYISFETLIWILKALVIRVSTEGFVHLNKLVGLLTSTPNLEVKQLIGKSLMILFIDIKIFTNQTPGVKQIISKVSNLNIKLLYKQRIFEIILPELIKGQSNKGEHSEVYLNSLSTILKNLPKNILVSHMAAIFPLVLTSLSLPKSKTSSDILKSTLSTLSTIIKEDQSTVEPHLTKLIPTLLTLATGKIVYEKKLINTEEVRILAFQNLILIFQRYEGLSKYKKVALMSLVPGLDDRRRNVRKLCCDLRQILYELD
ncbi:RNAPII transcription regulator C-terminal-domain-containing protein [Scheffersomyces xylosifermentans]|uniref:RNAPII transcription regulator C-terminal-domain-containing protein n=1 Tax=Scheffersomyces xylosifermentans TaxID=1304137 RepID=UPI00315DA0A9